eukprot:5853365-Pleurochrysis_carterae.AAC.1
MARREPLTRQGRDGHPKPVRWLVAAPRGKRRRRRRGEWRPSPPPAPARRSGPHRRERVGRTHPWPRRRRRRASTTRAR